MTADPAYPAALGDAARRGASRSGLARALSELWFNAQTDAVEVAVPALLMGFSVSARQRGDPARGAIGRPPRGRALSLQHRRRRLRLAGRRLPAAAVARDPGQRDGVDDRRPRSPSCRSRWRDSGGNAGGGRLAGSIAPRAARRSWRVAAAASGLRHRPGAGAPGRRRTAAHDARRAHRGRRGDRIARQRTHGCSPTATRCRRRRRLSQRYMRALAHIPLLAIDGPEAVLVIGFGVGNTTHAATLHPSIRRVEVADLSTDILASRRLLQRRQRRRAARPARGGVRQRRPAASADAAAALLRPDHAGAAADRLCRRGGAVFAGVLRAGADAAQAGGLHQPVAAGVPGARRRRRWR